MPSIIIALNLDMLNGSELFKEICESIEAGEGISKKIEDKVFSESGWDAKDFEEQILASGKLLNSTIRLPKKQPFKKCKIAVSITTRHLLVKVGKQWWQTGYTIRTRKSEVGKV